MIVTQDWNLDETWSSPFRFGIFTCVRIRPLMSHVDKRNESSKSINVGRILRQCLFNVSRVSSSFICVIVSGEAERFLDARALVYVTIYFNGRSAR